MLSSSFPSFVINDADGPDGYAHWVSWFYSDKEQQAQRKNNRSLLVAPGFDSPLYGAWNNSTVIPGGIGGSGVTCVFNADGSVAAVISPFDSFMAASQLSPSAGIRMMGVMGNVTEISAGYSMRTVVYFGDGINAAMSNWGDAIRGYYGKSDVASSAAAQSDVTLTYLGYSTDNGAFYYYNTVPGLNYQDTMLAVKAYADEAGLPYRYVLLDSW